MIIKKGFRVLFFFLSISSAVTGVTAGAGAASVGWWRASENQV